MVNDRDWYMRQAAVLIGQQEAANRQRKKEEEEQQAELDLLNIQQVQVPQKPLQIGKHVNPTG